MNRKVITTLPLLLLLSLTTLLPQKSIERKPLTTSIQNQKPISRNQVKRPQKKGATTTYRLGYANPSDEETSKSYDEAYKRFSATLQGVDIAPENAKRISSSSLTTHFENMNHNGEEQFPSALSYNIEALHGPLLQLTKGTDGRSYFLVEGRPYQDADMVFRLLCLKNHTCTKEIYFDEMERGGEERVLPVEIERESLEVIKKRTAHHNEKMAQLAMAEEEKEESLAHQKDEDLS